MLVFLSGHPLSEWPSVEGAQDLADSQSWPGRRNQLQSWRGCLQQWPAKKGEKGPGESGGPPEILGQRPLLTRGSLALLTAVCSSSESQFFHLESQWTLEIHSVVDTGVLSPLLYPSPAPQEPPGDPLGLCPRLFLQHGPWVPSALTLS